eukprot:scaffold7661_cov390-Prasinococcus_capsulatus_cf.AAC.1
MADYDLASPGSGAFYLYLGVCTLLVGFAGLMSGLSLGLCSLTPLELEVIERSGSPTEQKQAKRLRHLLKHQHILLVTLLVCNSIAMEALPVFLGHLVHPALAIVISVTLVLFFGEIIPQSVCQKYGMVRTSSCPLVSRVRITLCLLAGHRIDHGSVGLGANSRVLSHRLACRKSP